MSPKKGAERPRVRKRSAEEKAEADKRKQAAKEEAEKESAASAERPSSSRSRKPSDRDRKPYSRDRKPADRDRKPYGRDRKPSDRDRKPAPREHKARPAPVQAVDPDEKWLRLARSGAGAGGFLRHGDIPAYKMGRELRNRLYRLCKDLGEVEKDNLQPRIKAAATTVTAALATGFGEASFAAAVQRSLESRGALVALQDHLDQLLDLELLEDELREELRQQVDEAIAAVNEFMGACAKAWK